MGAEKMRVDENAREKRGKGSGYLVMLHHHCLPSLFARSDASSILILHLDCKTRPTNLLARVCRACPARTGARRRGRSAPACGQGRNTCVPEASGGGGRGMGRGRERNGGLGAAVEVGFAKDCGLILENMKGCFAK